MLKPDVGGVARKMSGLFFLMLLLFSCATYGPAPVGGEKDIIPPKFIGSTPENGATNFIAKQVRLNFNEYVQLKDAGKIFISPQLKGISYSANLKQVRIDIMDTLDPEVTYTVNFGNSLTDINESNPAMGFQYVFSRSSSIDTDYISGIILDAFTLEPVPDMSILLFNENKDSLYLVKDPNYIGTTDSNGRFIVNHIKNGCYYIYGIKEKTKNYAIEANEEKIAYSDTCIATAAGEVANDALADSSAVATSDALTDSSAVATSGTLTDSSAVATSSTLTDSATVATSSTLTDGSTVATSDALADSTAVATSDTLTDNSTVATSNALTDSTAVATSDALTDSATVATSDALTDSATVATSSTLTDGSAVATSDTMTAIIATNELVLFLYQDREPQYFLKEGAFSRRGIINIKFNYPINDLSVFIADTINTEITLADDKMSATIYTSEMNLTEAHAVIKSGEYTDTLDLLLTEQQLKGTDTSAFKYSVSANKDKLFSGDSILLTFTLPLFDYLGDTQLNFTATGEEDTISGVVVWEKISSVTAKIKHDWKNEYSYKITVPYCTFSDFFDRSIDTSYITAKGVSLEQLGEFGISISGLPAGRYFLQLLNNKNVPVQQVAFTGSEEIVDIKFIPSGDYTVWIYEDLNGNSKWDEGDFYGHLHPEKRWKYNKTIKIEADWRIEEKWQIK